MTLTGIIALGQCGPGSNVNEGVLHTPQISRTGVSRSDVVYCHTKDRSFERWGSYPFAGDIVTIFWLGNIRFEIYYQWLARSFPQPLDEVPEW